MMRSGSALRPVRSAYRPWLESLEDRFCPSDMTPPGGMPPPENMTPSISFMISPAGPMLYTLSGSVMDEAPGGLCVNFSGVYAGSTLTDSNGNFSVNVTPSQLGAVTAEVTDNEGLSATPVEQSCMSFAPSISLTASRQILNVWVLSGTVMDEHAAGLTVRFGGLPSLEGKTATVASDGSYSLTVELAQGEEGTATAQTTDWWGLDSNLAEYMIHPSA